MSADLAERLAAGDVLLGDGAWGSVLMERGLKPGACPERLVLTRPEIVAQLAREYLAAGADLIMTNTFGASPLKLQDYGLGAEAAAINRQAVSLLRRLTGGRTPIIGSVGPTGRLLKPVGDTDPDAVARAFSVQIDALIDAGVDAVCVETMVDIEEAKLAIAAARGGPRHLPIFATMTFEETPHGPHTIMGVSVAEAARQLARAGAQVVGANCGLGMGPMLEVARIFKRETTLPLMFQANAGKPVWQAGRWTYPETPEGFAEAAKSLLETGIAIIGGCCGTGPAHIARLRDEVNRVNAAHHLRKGI